MTLPPLSDSTSLERLVSSVQLEVARTLSQALDGHDITVDQAVELLGTTGVNLLALTLTADELRRRTIGDVVTYVVNRNVNFTNVCIKRCGFCAFSRDFRQEEGYYLPEGEILRRAQQASDLGATEICVQAGLPPKMKGDLYIRLCEAIKEKLPDIHIHGFSPEEVLYGSVRSGWSIRDYLKALKDAGVGSLPGTSAEILDQELRDHISPGRITVEQWTEVITTAHDLGIPTTSTIMFGHVETPHHVASHIDYIRSLQKVTGGFTEFVPLSFVHSEAPMYSHGLVDNIRQGPDGVEVMRVHAVARLLLNNHIPNLQVSWVKEGPRLAQLLLTAGANDLGGTLINESISTSAGAGHGQLLRPSEFRQLIRQAGRIPAERNTKYEILKHFGKGDEDLDPLDLVQDTSQFGSYFQLIEMDSFRYEHPKAAGKTTDS